MDDTEGTTANGAYLDSQKKITLPSCQQRALNALENDENGAEWEILDVLTDALLSGKTIEPAFQTIVNAIVAKAFLSQKLPGKRKGRPTNKEGIGHKVAVRYFSLVDSGVRYADAVTQVACEFSKDERHIMRLVKEHKSMIGETVEARKKNREMWTMMREIHESARAEGRKTYLDLLTEYFSEVDPNDSIEELEMLIDRTLTQLKNT